MSGDNLPTFERENYTYLVSITGIKLRSVSPYPLSKNENDLCFLNICLPVEYTGEKEVKIKW
jgi:hypothetical protein